MASVQWNPLNRKTHRSDMRISKRFSVLAVIALLGLSGCVRDAGHDMMHEASPWDDFVHNFIEATLAAHPNFAVVSGRHEYDGEFPDWSPEGIAAEIARLHAARAEAEAFDPETLTAHQGFQREYVIAVIDRILFWLETAEWPFRNPDFYFDWTLDSLDPNVYVAREYAPLEDRARSFTKYANGLPKVADQIIANLRTPLPRTYIEKGVATFGGLATFFENDLPVAFSGLEDPAVKEAFNDARGRGAAAMERVATWLEAQRPEATDDFAIGKELFQEMVTQTEGVDVSVDTLKMIGEADLERNLAALKEACAEYAPGKSVHACVDRVNADKPEGGAVVGARRQLVDLHAFLEKEDIVSIPGTEEALVEEAPPYNRSNSAYIDIPGPFEESLPSVYYIAPPDPKWTPEEQLAYVPGKATLLFTSVHEVWPGHFLQFLHANRSDDVFGRVFVGYAFAEGWAHYSEEMMWEAGLGDGDPEVHIGQLLEALLRNVRYLSAIGLHTEGMTVEESERMFREEAFYDPGNARQQAARGTYDPAYLNYTMGKLMIRKLRADWTARRGDRLSWKAFHDRFLSFGGPPIPLVRKAMMVTDHGTLF